MLSVLVITASVGAECSVGLDVPQAKHIQLCTHRTIGGELYSLSEGLPLLFIQNRYGDVETS